MTETNPHPETRVTSERGIKAHIMGIDGTWRRACTMAGRDRAEGKDKMTKRATATLVWTREEDDQLRACGGFRREYCRTLEAPMSQRKSDLA